MLLGPESASTIERPPLCRSRAWTTATGGPWKGCNPELQTPDPQPHFLGQGRWGRRGKCTNQPSLLVAWFRPKPGTPTQSCIAISRTSTESCLVINLVSRQINLSLDSTESFLARNLVLGARHGSVLVHTTHADKLNVVFVQGRARQERKC